MGDRRYCRGAGSYWSETDFFERDFQLSYWGAEKYKKLLVRAAARLPRSANVCGGLTSAAPCLRRR